MVSVPEYNPIAWAQVRSTLRETSSVIILHHSQLAPSLPRISLAQERLIRWLRESPDE